MNGTRPGWEPLTQRIVGPGIADTSKGRPPQAFISYAWENHSHAKWVHDLAWRLQKEGGIRILLDQWLDPGSDLSVFMEQGIQSCDSVIVVCTPTYAEKANGREGGVGYETMIISSDLGMQIETHKFIPVLRRGEWKSSLPTYLRSKRGVDLQNDPFSETQFKHLVHALHRVHIPQPPIGPKPQFLAEPADVSGSIPEARDARSDQVKWNEDDPGPCIDVNVTNSREVIEAGRAVGLEYPEPLKMKALLDSGASVTVISKAFARYCKLMQTGETEIRALGGLHRCGEHAAAINFPGTRLRSIDPIKLFLLIL